jgi:hypothetical protein
MTINNKNDDDDVNGIVVSYDEWMRFKELYQEAKDTNKECFKFKEMDVYTTFAMYLIQHIERTLPPEHKILAGEPANIGAN